MRRPDRLMAILIALQQRPETAGRLAEKFEVNKRTILRDMQALSEMGIPLYAVPGPNGGFRLMEGYRLPPLQLDADEALTVLFALGTLARMNDTPFKHARWTAADKLRAILPETTLREIAPMLEVVAHEVPPRTVRSPLLAELSGIAARRRWVRALYRSERQRRWLELRPSRIFAANGFWYCEAYSATHGEARTFRVDRIEQAEAIDGPSASADRAEGAGMPPPSADVRIVARLTYRGALLAEQDAHFGGNVKQLSDDAWSLAFDCPGSERGWAARFFFSLGMDAEVLEPPELRREIAGMAGELRKRYEQEAEGDGSA